MRFLIFAFLVSFIFEPHLAAAKTIDVQQLTALAEKGDVAAASELGNFYLRDRNGKANDGLALKWAQAAAEKGDARSQDNMSVIYREGRGVAQSEEESVKWMRAAAEQGYANSEYKLALAYRDGVGIGEDKAQYLDWLKKSVAGGNRTAQYDLAQDAEAKGDGAAALKWYRASAEQGNPKAQLKLGAIYEGGKDYAQAAKWYRKAVEITADEKALLALGEFYRKGLGVKQDNAEAYFWHALALNRNWDVYVPKPQMVLTGDYARPLGQQDIDAQKKRVAEWVASHQSWMIHGDDYYIEDDAGKHFAHMLSARPLPSESAQAIMTALELAFFAVIFYILFRFVLSLFERK